MTKPGQILTWGQRSGLTIEPISGSRKIHGPTRPNLGGRRLFLRLTFKGE